MHFFCIMSYVIRTGYVTLTGQQAEHPEGGVKTGFWILNFLIIIFQNH